MDYFEKYLKIAPFSHALWRSREAEAININFKKPILDIGCGFGEFAGVFFNFKLEVGIDINENDLIEAAKGKKYKKLTLADARRLPFKQNSFATVISISTLEHIKNVEIVFKEVKRILAPKGFFIFTVPTTEINRNLIIGRLLKKIHLNFLSKLYISFIHYLFSHQSLFSKEKWIKMAKKNGFKIKKVKSTITKLEVVLWELGLPTASFSQITRVVYNKRWVWSFRLRESFFKNTYHWLRNKIKSKGSDANVLIVCQKK